MNFALRLLFRSFGLLIIGSLLTDDIAAQTQVLIVVGPSNHAAGTHEVLAGGRLLKHCLESSSDLQDLTVKLVQDWPDDDAVLNATSTVVFLGDTFPLQRLPETGASLSRLGEMMNRGCGIVCIHYATGLRDEDVAADGEHPLLHWMGGYFATRCRHHQSIARIYESATIEPAAAGHPIWNGCSQFTITDEPYINNYFGPHDNQPAANVTALATSLLPPEAPQPEIVAWCVQRPDQGRGFAIVMPHFYRNWQVDDLRRFVLNGVVWTAGQSVPDQGVRCKVPDLAVFEPEAVEPAARKR